VRKAAAGIEATLGPGRDGRGDDVASRRFRGGGLSQSGRAGVRGLDLLVSNAGVLKAGEREDVQPEKDFQFVTSVNYTGYSSASEGGAVMAVQHLARRSVSDIVQ